MNGQRIAFYPFTICTNCTNGETAFTNLKVMYSNLSFMFPQVPIVMVHPVNRLSTHCITSMATLPLSYRSSQHITVPLYTDILFTDQHLVADMTSK